ncbi:MAG: hypothetical protein L0H79_15000 [Intrasporangium sp.]|uniref:hypothetical protein n=1 Tax=Intrasporangium sp. TaxID=1925024 RepID=UPI002649078A|nr:hypothetical protein [Intrasporangium sp.]MDN5797048.1 hypothetical protein [Intrasporangium sp.]
MAEERRGRSRDTATSFRMSADDYASLRRAVDEGGYGSLQELLEVRVFGAVRPRRKTGPRPRRQQEERLDISA